MFHSISAFNNAGFDLMGGFDSLGGFASDPLVLVPLAVLIVLGGLGVAIVGDIAAKRGWVRLALETKLVVVMTVALIVGGMLALLVFEWSNPRDARRAAAAPAAAQRAVRVDRVPVRRDDARSRSASSPARACSSASR